MIKSVFNYPISTLLDIESNLIYSVPRYQREYTWGKNQWDTLFEDLLENNSSYFLGSIICINKSTDTLATQDLELVDGQQRMTTLSLMLAAVYKTLSDVPNPDINIQVELLNLKHKLVLKSNNEQPRLIPQAQNSNKQDYFYILSQLGLLDQNEMVANAGNRRIIKGYRHFLHRLEQYSDGDVAKRLIDFLKKINTSTLVKIEVANHSDAYTLFESLNNRGVPLTAIDLIKNKLLAKLEIQSPNKIEIYYKKWKQVIEALGDDYAVQERFFRQYYNGFKNELNDVVAVPIATKSNLMIVYEKLVNYDPVYFLDEMKRLSNKYANLTGLKPISDEEKLNRSLRSLDRIQGTPAYLLLMVLLDKRDSLALNEEMLADIVNFIVSFFVRRNATDSPPTRDLTRIFMSINEKTSVLKGEELVSYIKQKLKSESSSNEVFSQKLKGPLYEENKGVCRFVLCAIEEESMTRESRRDLWIREGKNYLWTIEHIFPQGENIPKNWVDMIADGDAQKAKLYLDQYAHCLGNLTISGYNSELGNKSFYEKQNRTDHKGRKVGYDNGLSLNKQLVEEASWTIEKISKRTDDLVEQILAKFEL